MTNPISLHEANPHYFVYKNKPTLLVTSAEHYGAVLNGAFDYRKYLEELKACGNNLTVRFSGEYKLLIVIDTGSDGFIGSLVNLSRLLALDDLQKFDNSMNIVVMSKENNVLLTIGVQPSIIEIIKSKTFKNQTDYILVINTNNGIINMVYNVFHKNHILISKTSISEELIQEYLYIGSVEQVKSWAIQILKKTSECLNDYSMRQSAIVEKIMSYIEKHIYEDFSQEDMAKSLYFSSDYLSKVFKKETGMLLSDYIITSRMQIAKKLLVETNNKIGTISQMLGYNQLSYFAKAFRKVVRISPQEFRNNTKR